MSPSASSTTGGNLAHTGASDTGWLAGAALVLLAAGGGLMLRRRKAAQH
jgi:LPXTG-motif cell wall-anchored protein